MGKAKDEIKKDEVKETPKAKEVNDGLAVDTSAHKIDIEVK